MKKEQIQALFHKFESICYVIECWGARELQKPLGYSKWENFEKVIENVIEKYTWSDNVLTMIDLYRKVG